MELLSTKMWNTKAGLKETIRSAAQFETSIKYPGRDVEYTTHPMCLGFRRMVRSGNGKVRVFNMKLI